MRIIESERLSEKVKKIVLEGNLGSSPGQYAMIWVPKVGEIPISIAREPKGETWILVAKVGKVSSAIHSLRIGEGLWVRGTVWEGLQPQEWELLPHRGRLRYSSPHITI
jgi:NAD(P)H-flavin reductase